mmetsp:Transcript_9265/g.13907  ORF Transcript_9265/g.13907 Transcript_9265/m.13907 type:complete len:108 (+) Transcript_9265:100-423(+)
MQKCMNKLRMMKMQLDALRDSYQRRKRKRRAIRNRIREKRRRRFMELELKTQKRYKKRDSNKRKRIVRNENVDRKQVEEIKGEQQINTAERFVKEDGGAYMKDILEV